MAEARREAGLPDRQLSRAELRQLHVTELGTRVTDNGDGTLTLLILNTGNSVLGGEDGKVIARNPGQVRV